MTPTLIPESLHAPNNCLDGRVILVTGATGTLGGVAARTFAANGATVILHGRKTAKLDAVYDQIEASGGHQPAMVVLDYLKAGEGDFKGLAETIYASFKRLDGIFHAAGHTSPLSPLSQQDWAAWQAYTAINLTAPIAVTRACLPMLKRAHAPAVVFLSETHATQPKAFWGAFSVTKSALQHTAAIWNDELESETALRLKVFIPGPVASQCRSITHPGELSSEVRPADSLSRAFLLLASADSRLPNATIISIA